MEAVGQLLTYLMDSVPFIKTKDLHGWKERFQPIPENKTNPKRLKMSPNVIFHEPLPKCIECLSEKVIEDVQQGQIVCVSCGLIQSRVVSTEAHAHCSMDALKNRSRVYIHRYSRISYFWTVTRLMQGETSPVISDADLSLLRVGIDGNVTAAKVNQRLRELGLAKKYRRHRWSLSRMLGGEVEFVWKPDVVLKMLKMFRRVEYYWRFCKKHLSITGKTFFSYPTLIFNFLQYLGESPPECLLLKNPTLRTKQENMYFMLCTFIVKYEKL